MSRPAGSGAVAAPRAAARRSTGPSTGSGSGPSTPAKPPLAGAAGAGGGGSRLSAPGTAARPRGRSTGGDAGNRAAAAAAAAAAVGRKRSSREASPSASPAPSPSPATPASSRPKPDDTSEGPAAASTQANGSSSGSGAPRVSVSSENIQVCVRIRPGTVVDDVSLYGWELSSDLTTLVDTGRESGGGVLPPSAVPASGPGSFRFNHVFGPECDTAHLYDECVRDSITHFMGGFNGTLFMYGQTGSGKTHTISAVTTMAVKQIFDSMAADPSRLYMLRCSNVEIYLEECNDLLAPVPKEGKNRPIREVGGAFKVSDLTETVVTSAADVYACIERGNASRKVGVSNLNEHSSRSHSIFRLTLESATKTHDASPTPARAGQKLSGAVMVSELNLVDLAGSETLSYDFGAGQQKETKAINLSLTQLKSVIQALSKNESFVPFRNSALTKLLRTSLGGNAKTTLVCTMNPLPLHAKTSRATLQFGQMAQTITNRASVNEVTDDSALMIKQYRAKIEGLESRLSDYSKLEEEKARMQREYLALQAHFNELQRREAEHRQLQSELSDASRMVVGGAEAVAAATAAAKAHSPVPSVSAEEMAALSLQLSALQSQKDELEQAKQTLESKLAEQQRVQRETEQAIRSAQRNLEESEARSEAEHERLRQLEQMLHEKSMEEAKRQQQEAALQEQLRQAQRLSEEKLAQSEALARQLEDQKRLNAQTSSQASLLQAQLDDAARDMQSKEAALSLMKRKADTDALALQRQSHLLDEARLKQSEKDAKAAELQRALARATEASAQASSAANERWNHQMRLMQESGLDKDSYLAQLINGYEDRLDEQKRALEEAESVKLVQQLDYENRIEQMKRDQAAAAKAQANAAAAAASVAANQQRPMSGASAAPVALPVAKPSAVGSFAQPPPGSPLMNGSLSLEIPGVIGLAEGEQLLTTPASIQPPCPSCGSRDRVRAEKLRSLANHAAKTLNHYHEQRAVQQKEIRELQGMVSVYEMQLKEFIKQRKA